MPETEPIKVIGLDCDDPHALEKLLRRQPDLFRQADMICGARAVLDKLRPDPELSGKLLHLTPPLEPLYASIFKLRSEGMKVLVLADGDPLFYGIGASLAKKAKSDCLQIRPAISCLQAACSRLNLPWHNIYCVSLHGRDNIMPLYDAVASGHPVCILTGGRATPDSLARFLLDRGIDWYDLRIFEHMGDADELEYAMSLKECANSFFGTAATILLIPNKKPRAPRLGLEEKRFRGKYATKKPVRGAILELLNIEPAHTVWDVGSGSGILALEICALVPSGIVMAIEKNPDRCLDIQANRHLVGAINLDILYGSAPACLDNLPMPQRIFIGGGFSGANAMKTLEKCAGILPPGGRLVTSCILLDSFSLCKNFMDSLGWPTEMLQIQAASASPLGEGTHLSPLNPVFLLTTQKP